MTGKELIIYILKNDLENEQCSAIFRKYECRDPSINCLGWVTIENYAEQCEVGVATVKAWIELGMLCSMRFDNQTYIPVWRRQS